MYKSYRCDSNSRHTGGVIIYVYDKIEIKKIYEKAIPNNLWCLIIKTKKLNKNWKFGVIYRSPSGSCTEFLDNLNLIIEEHINLRENNIFVGDFNIDMNRINLHTNKLNEIFLTADMKQCVNFDTRITEYSSTKIDLIYCNIENLNCDRLVQYQISDHETISFDVPAKDELNMRITKDITIWKYYNGDMLINYLRQYNLNVLHNCDIDYKLKYLDNILVEIVSEMVFKQTVIVKVRNKWYDKELSDMNKFKYDLYRIALETGQWNEFKLIKKQYKKLIKLKKIKYMENKIDMNIKNSREMWKYLKEISNLKEQKSEIKKIKINNIVYKTDQNIAQNLNKFVVNSVEKINDSIDLYGFNRLTLNFYNEIQLFKFKMVSSNDLCVISKDLKYKIGGRNLITEGVMKDSLKYTAHFYAKLINESFMTGVVPEKWKLTTIFPIQKVANTMLAEELRPINTIMTDAKIVELVVKKQLIAHINLNHILIDEQSGFRSKHSCETALNLVISEWKNSLKDKMNIVATFLDLKRAFETVDRNILLDKLQKMGISGTELKWMTSYLSNRQQQVIFFEAMSTKINSNIGLPQGTVLAPLFFILYINDIKTCLKYCKIRLFADDALLMIADRNLEHALKLMQEDMDNLYVWLCQNKLKLNINKTKFMILTRNHVNSDSCILKVRNENIDKVNVIKYLGVMIDDKLNFDEHVNYTRNKIVRKIGILARSTKLLNRNYKAKIYNSIILPHFTYCTSILFLLNTTQIDKLQKLQNRAMRFILNKSYDTHIISMLNELRWLNVKQIIMFHTIKFIHNIRFGNSPGYLSALLQRNNVIHSYNTRRREDYRLPFMRTSNDMNCLEYKGVKLYNELPSNIKNCENFTLFKKLLKEYCRNY